METINKEGWTAQIIQDEDAQNPRTDYDNFGTMFCWHPRYTLGDQQFQRGDFESMAAVRRHLEKDLKARVVLPLALLDHSGLWMQVGNSFACDPGGWDTTHVGYIYATEDQIRKEFGPRITKAALAKTETILRGEVETYNQYLTGDVYGVVVEDPDGTQRDSCWGFYGDDYAKEEAERMLTDAMENEAKQAKGIAAMMHL
jgi:hypothetical protein